MPNSDSLEHYGVLGMKWGVRRTPEELDRKVSAYKEKQREKVTRIYNRQVQKATRASEKGRAESREVEKRIRNLKNTCKKELEAINKITYDTIKEERKKKIKSAASKTFFGVVGGLTGYSAASYIRYMPTAWAIGGEVFKYQLLNTGLNSAIAGSSLTLATMSEKTTRSGEKWLDSHFSKTGKTSR